MTRVWNLMSRRQAFGSLVLTMAGLTLTACGGTQLRETQAPAAPDTAQTPPDFSARFAQFAPADEPNGDLAKVIWPTFVTTADPEVKELYAFQITQGELMRWMPCFCGCGQSAGHRSNRDCYVQAVNPDRSVVLDAMGRPLEGSAWGSRVP